MQKKIKLKIKKYPIKINSNGELYYNGSLIRKKTLIKLSSSILKADNNGNFFLETPAEKGSIVVEDANYNKYGHITSVKAHPSGSIGNIEYFLVCN